MHSTHHRRGRGRAFAAAVALFAGSLTGIATAAPAGAAAGDLFFSEYIEGSSNNKALEIYNGTGAAVDLAAAGYSVQMFFNGSSSAGLTVNLTGTVADGDVFVLAQSSANATILAQADQTNGSGWFNGDDAVVLRKGTAALDVIGQIGFDPGTEWGTGLTSTADNTLRRKASVLQGDADGTNAFDPAVEWDGFATDTFDGLGSHTVDQGSGGDAAPTLVSSTPAAGATGVHHDATLSLTFSEPVDLETSAVSLTCDGSARTLTVSGGPTTFTLTPTPELGYSQDCILTIPADAVSDRDGVDPLHAAADATVDFTTENEYSCEAPVTTIPEIQGTGETSPMAGQSVVTRGVVVGDYEGASPALRGFYLQDPQGDDDPSTSDGVFVFNSNFDQVSLGELVTVTGNVSEFQGQTQVSASRAPLVCGSGDVEPTQVTLPVDSGLERYEGMLTTFPQTMTVNETFQLGRFGQLTVSSAGRLMTPTAVVDPGQPALDLQAENDATRLIVDDASQVQNPDPIVFGRGGQPLSANNTLRMGDTATDLTGVLTYTWAGNAASGNAYRLRPLQALHGHAQFDATNPRPDQPEPVGGNLRVASVNVLNYFNTFTGCTNGVGGEPTDCRGAESATELERQQTKTVNVIKSLDADVIGLMEIENDGYGPNSAIHQLTEAVNTATGDTYAYVDVDAGTGEVNAAGTDAIKVGLLYRTSRVELVGRTAALNTGAFGLYENNDPGSTGPIGRNRPALAQAFEDRASGERVVVSVNHLKSKGSSCVGNISPVPSDPDLHDGQGNCNQTRTQAARELAAWLASDPTQTSDPDALIIGDLNSYAQEDPVDALQDAGFRDMIAAKVNSPRYSYVFDGQSGYLDHALASESLTGQVTDVTEFHVNADEPSVLDYNTNFKSPDQVDSLYAPDHFRASDHDPVLVGLELGLCSYSDDTGTHTRTLVADCKTSKTLGVPDGWTFDGAGHTVTAYDPAGGHFVGAVIANVGTTANVRDVTITGYRLKDVCDSGADRLRGILLDGAEGSITGTRVIGLRQVGSGCQEGNAIEVRNAPFDTTGSDTSVTIENNEVSGYQKSGIVVNGSVAATVANNRVSGLGPVPYIAQNGVQVGFGATAVVDGNTISDNWYTGPDVACGLLLYQADGVKQKRNTFSGNEQDFCNFGRGGGNVSLS